MQGGRTVRVADLLKQEIADILTKNIRDPRIGFVTVTHVDVSSDLCNARICVSIQENKSEEKAFAGLKKASGFIRGSLARRLSLRRIPALTFASDKDTDKISHLLGVLEQVSVEEESLRHHREKRSEGAAEGVL